MNSINKPIKKEIKIFMVIVLIIVSFFAQGSAEANPISLPELIDGTNPNFKSDMAINKYIKTANTQGIRVRGLLNEAFEDKKGIAVIVNAMLGEDTKNVLLYLNKKDGSAIASLNKNAGIEATCAVDSVFGRDISDVKNKSHDSYGVVLSKCKSINTKIMPKTIELKSLISEANSVDYQTRKFSHFAVLANLVIDKSSVVFNGTITNIVKDINSPSLKLQVNFINGIDVSVFINDPLNIEKASLKKENDIIKVVGTLMVYAGRDIFDFTKSDSDFVLIATEIE